MVQLLLYLCLLSFSFFSSNISLIFYALLNVLNTVSSQGESTTIVQQAFMGPLLKDCFFPPRNQVFAFWQKLKCASACR